MYLNGLVVARFVGARDPKFEFRHPWTTTSIYQYLDDSRSSAIASILSSKMLRTQPHSRSQASNAV